MNQVSVRVVTERTELKFDSLGFLVHGSVRDFLRYLPLPSSKLSLLLDKVCAVFYPVWDSKMINIKLF